MMILSHKKPTKKSLISQFLIYLALLSFGIYFSIIGIDVVSEGRASMKWPQTTGIIESSRIVRMDDKHIKYQIEMKYKYEVKGESYTNGRFSLNSYPTRSARTNADIVNPLPAGKKVTVYYNPENPVISVLQPGINSITFIPATIGIVLIVISIGSGLICYSEIRKTIKLFLIVKSTYSVIKTSTWLNAKQMHKIQLRYCLSTLKVSFVFCYSQLYQSA